MNWIEREEQQLEDDLASGLISQKEFNAEMKELQQAYRDEAREAAQDAYDREMDRW